MLITLARNWWTWVLRGAAAMLFGVLLIARPAGTLAVTILLFGAYALVDGIFNVVGAVGGAASRERWGSLLLQGLVGIGAGLVALLWPGLTAVALLYWIAAWAIVSGVLEISAAIRLRHEIRHEWLLGLMGAASIAFGVFIMRSPGRGALAMISWIAAFAITFGVLEIALGLRLHSSSSKELAGLLQRNTPQHA